MKLEGLQREEVREIAAELARIARTGGVLPGSIAERRTRCGQPDCVCQSDPDRRHGPYWQWTRKVAGKTTGRYLSQEEATQGRVWIENDRRLRELLKRLEAIWMERLETERHRD